MIKLRKADRFCKGVPPWAPHRLLRLRDSGAPTEGRPYKSGRWIFLLLTLILMSQFDLVARADGGVVMCQRTSAPFTITLFSTEMPLRPGPADLSVLLEQPDGH